MPCITPRTSQTVSYSSVSVLKNNKKWLVRGVVLLKIFINFGTNELQHKLSYDILPKLSAELVALKIVFLMNDCILLVK